MTPAWWDNLWLNEGFASWMEIKATDHFNPAWQMWLNAAAENYAAALTIVRKHPADSSLATRIIQNYAAVLRAMHHNREAKALALELKLFRPQNLK